MGRPLRIEYPGALYHITSRGNEKKDIFLDSSDRKKFLDILKDYHERYEISIYCYMLMDNHYHLVFETAKPNLLKVMHGINSSYTLYFNRKYGRVGHLFQGRYKGILVDKDSYLLELSRYVHRNPLRAGMVKRAEDYYWSSYPSYIWKKKRQAWMDYALILSQFSTREGDSQKRYKAFVDKVEKTEMNPLNAVFGQTILGGEDFLKKVKQILRNKKVGKEVVNRKRFSERPKGEMILSAVAKKLNMDEREIRETKKRGHIGKDLTVYLMKKYSDMTNGEIAAIFGGMHPSAITKIAQRTESKVQSDEGFKKIGSELISIFKA
jgi:REP element-mobilizing transposase RayT